jgi:DNA-binding CsgD family transcriptional regulator
MRVAPWGSRRKSAMTDLQTVPTDNRYTIDTTTALMRELVAHLRENRTGLREEWLRRIFEAELLTAMTREEVFAEATSVYDSYVEALETRTLETLQSYAQSLCERIIAHGVETHEVVGIVLLLRDVLARSLFGKYHANFRMLNAVLDAYEPAANSIAITVAVGFVQQRGTQEHNHRSPRASSAVVQAFLADSTSLDDPLTPREREVLQLVAGGRSTKEVAGILGVSVKTAETHRTRLMTKLDIHHTAGLVHYAIRRGLVRV